METIKVTYKQYVLLCMNWCRSGDFSGMDPYMRDSPINSHLFHGHFNALKMVWFGGYVHLYLKGLWASYHAALKSHHAVDHPRVSISNKGVMLKCGFHISSWRAGKELWLRHLRGVPLMKWNLLSPYHYPSDFHRGLYYQAAANLFHVKGKILSFCMNLTGLSKRSSYCKMQMPTLFISTTKNQHISEVGSIWQKELHGYLGIGPKRFLLFCFWVEFCGINSTTWSDHAGKPWNWTMTLARWLNELT